MDILKKTLTIPKAKTGLVFGLTSFLLIFIALIAVYFDNYWISLEYIVGILFMFLFGILFSFIGMGFIIYGNKYYRKQPLIYAEKSILIFNIAKYLNLALIVGFLIFILMAAYVFNGLF